MEIVMVIVAIFLVGFGTIVVLGKSIGAPNPRVMSGAQLQSRLKSESSWINRYLRLSIEDQQKGPLKKLYLEKEQYVRELVLEYNARMRSNSGSQNVANPPKEKTEQPLESKAEQSPEPTDIETALTSVVEHMNNGFSMPTAIQSTFPSMSIAEIQTITERILVYKSGYKVSEAQAIQVIFERRFRDGVAFGRHKLLHLTSQAPIGKLPSQGVKSKETSGIFRLAPSEEVQREKMRINLEKREIERKAKVET